MTIASTNVGFSAIATEKGIGNNNLSLKTLSGKEVKMDTVTGQGYSSSYALAKEKWIYSADSSRNTSSMTVTSAQGTGSAGLNTAPYSMSEWFGYDSGRPNIGTGSIPVAKFYDTNGSANCVGTHFGSINIYCKKVSGVIKFYVNVGSHGNCIVKTYNNNTTYNNFSGETQIGEMVANTTNMIPSGCTMSTGAGGGTGYGGTAWNAGATLATTTGGATSTTNLGSTKIGYLVGAGGAVEGGNYESWTMQHKASCRFNWTWPTSPSGDAYENSFTDIIVQVYLQGQHSNPWGC
jgi:hypothetical protein